MVDRQKTTVSSTITAELLHLTLKRGALFGVCGALMIIITGTFFPIELLKIWGAPLFFVGLILIGVGLLPYRQLTRLQLKPHELIFDGETITFLQQGKSLFQIPRKSIERLSYSEKDHLYGLAVWLANSPEEKVKILQHKFNLEGFILDSQGRFEGCTLFFPYFTKRVCQEVIDWLE